jgi:hypothetical protein
VVSPEIFQHKIVPAFQAVAAQEGNVVKNLPVSEVDVLVERSRLNADPATAFAQTATIARSVRAAAPDETYLIDNISNTLEVARDDASVGRRMFIFLGFPGVLLAVFLTAYSGSILASSQRRRERSPAVARSSSRAPDADPGRQSRDLGRGGIRHRHGPWVPAGDGGARPRRAAGQRRHAT